MSVLANRKSRKPGHKHRLVGRASLTLSLLIAAAWLLSGWFGAGFDLGVSTAVLRAHVQDGCCTLMLFDQYQGFHSNWSAWRAEVPSALNYEPVPFFPPGLPKFWRWEARWSNNWTSAATYVRFPVWAPSLLTGSFAVLLLRSGAAARRRASTGECSKCGYDLAGLAEDATCPECGPAKTQPQINAD
ncbi:MAG: hypothetical protein QM783_14840 [Phycisphaerales bacterium]